MVYGNVVAVHVDAGYAWSVHDEDGRGRTTDGTDSTDEEDQTTYDANDTKLWGEIQELKRTHSQSFCQYIFNNF
jgi:hypothetical protein